MAQQRFYTFYFKDDLCHSGQKREVFNFSFAANRFAKTARNLNLKINTIILINEFDQSGAAKL